MAQPYEVRPSPGKGNGVFAAKDIQAGAVMMRDRPLIKINKDPLQIKESDVLDCIRHLPNHKQANFFRLHEGSRPYNTRAFRIWKANAFGYTGTTCLYYTISFINHSCLPNAELDSGDGEELIYAIKDIRQGEEIHISYNPHHIDMTKPQRAGMLGCYYGFTCTCAACAQPPKQLWLSDTRRKLLSVLTSALEGFQPMNLSHLEQLPAMSKNAAEAPEVLSGIPQYPLSKPLTARQRTVYSFLCASLLEAEGLTGMTLAINYKEAASGLLEQMSQDPYTVLLPAARNVVAWMERALRVTELARGRDSEHSERMRELWRDMREDDQLFAALGFYQNAQARDTSASFAEWTRDSEYFALCMEKKAEGVGYAEAYSKRDYLEKIRRGGLRVPF